MTNKNNIPQFVNSESFMLDKNYVKWLSGLKKRIRVAQVKAAINVNVEMLKLYWSLGEDICEKQKQYKWIEGNMSRAELEHAIEAKLYEHTGKALNNFAVTLPQPQNELANEMLKDPYKFDFISMKEWNGHYVA